MNKVKINHDYFSLNSKMENITSFIQQGNVFSHLVDRIKWYYCPKLFLVPVYPTHLDLEASSACQMKCPMCKTTEMVKKGKGRAGVMDFDLYRKIIDDIAGEPVYSIKLSWRGEPLLNPKIVEMVAYAKEKKIRDVAFLTNAERLNSDLSKQLVDAGLDWISISFDGMGEIYNRIRKPAIFEETLEKVQFIRNYREKAKTKHPLIRIQSVHSAIRGKETEFLDLWGRIADRVNFIADQKRSIDEKDYRHDPYYICPSPWQRMCVSWEGKVVQCYGDYLEENTLGDVRERSIKEIWHDSAFRDLRQSVKIHKRLVNKPCRTCSDGGITEQEDIFIGKRRIKAAYYVEQGIDVKELYSDPESDF